MVYILAKKNQQYFCLFVDCIRSKLYLILMNCFFYRQKEKKVRAN